PDCDTLVQYMGGREAAATAQKLLSRGRSGTTPVIVVENCSRENQKILRLSLMDLAQGLPGMAGPVLVMIGQAMAQRCTIASRAS
ncbi:MAG: SAM-dependent methyltransferase, partial [Oxalobacteraceae bacterium]